MEIYIIKYEIFIWQKENIWSDCGFLHFRYVKSRSDQQLRDPKSENEVDACKPEDKAGGQPVVPCGLIAWSLFNDTYSFSHKKQQSTEPLTVNKKDISWKSDRDHKFGKKVFPKNFQNGTLQGGATLNASKPVSNLPLLISSFEVLLLLLCIFEDSEPQ